MLWTEALPWIYGSAAFLALVFAFAHIGRRRRAGISWAFVCFAVSLGLFFGYDAVLWRYIVGSSDKLDMDRCAAFVYMDVVAALFALCVVGCMSQVDVNTRGRILRNRWFVFTILAFGVYCILVCVYWVLLAFGDHACTLFAVYGESLRPEVSPLGKLRDLHPTTYWAIWAVVLYGLCGVFCACLACGKAKAQTYAFWLTLAMAAYAILGPNGGLPWYFRVTCAAPFGAMSVLLILQSRCWSRARRRKKATRSVGVRRKAVARRTSSSQ